MNVWGGLKISFQVLAEPVWYQGAPHSNQASSDSMQALVSVEMCFFPCSRHSVIMDTSNKKMNTKEKKEKKKRDSGKGVVEKKEDEEVGSSKETDDVELDSIGSLDESMEEQLDSMSLGTIASVSSSILNTPNRSSVQAVQEHGDSDPRRNGETAEKGGGLRMSDAELKRFNWLLGQGHSLAAARELCRFSVVSQKRQRSEDQPSPNTGGQSGPQNKKSKDNHNPGPGITIKELAEAVPIAITTVGYPETRLSLEQLAAVKEALITTIGNLVNPVVRPNFRSCDFKQGYLILACGDAGTASWLKEAITTLIPWEGASLKAIEVADLPKLHSFTAYVFDSCNDSTVRILQLMENQNIGLSTKSWRVIKRKVIAKTVELLLEVDEKSAETIAANNSHLNFKFSKVRLRKVTGGASTAKRGNSVAQSSNPAKGGTVQQKGSKGGKQQPSAKANTVKPNPQAQMQKPIASSNDAATGTEQKTACGSKPQPPGTSNAQKPLKGKGSKPVPPSSRALGSLHEDPGSSHIGDTAVGIRQPTLESNGQRAEGGTLPGQ